MKYTLKAVNKSNLFTEDIEVLCGSIVVGKICKDVNNEKPKKYSCKMVLSNDAYLTKIAFSNDYDYCMVYIKQKFESFLKQLKEKYE